MSWVLVFVSDEPYIEKTIKTIIECRTIGKWSDDIVLITNENLYNNTEIIQSAKILNIQLRKVRPYSFQYYIDSWNKDSSHSEYNYNTKGVFGLYKYECFDTYFKKYETVFHLDAGAVIMGDLNRIKKSCKPDNCLYAHSDGYPTYKWKLDRQFNHTIDTKNIRSKYNLDCNYFQGTILIFDTKIILDDTADRLYKLTEEYPITIRRDQGIFNLYFTCERNLWKQIPLCDNDGFLYDFHEREGRHRSDYVILKYPRTA